MYVFMLIVGYFRPISTRFVIYKFRRNYTTSDFAKILSALSRTFRLADEAVGSAGTQTHVGGRAEEQTNWKVT
jgi:hypothetical protein